MTNPRGDKRGTRLPLFISGPHPCSYLSELTARTLFLDPMARVNGALYEQLLQQGFRRSGSHIYRPACDDCRRCVAVRVPVRAFRPNRSQRRNALRNGKDIELVDRPARWDPVHFALYETYLQGRHADGDMAENLSVESYQDFLVAPWGGETRLLELRLEGRPIAVAVTDRLPCALSAVYTFFDPAVSDRGPGIYALICQIELARKLGLDYLYLGYWIEECAKMVYKDAYRPLQAWIDGRWRDAARGQAIPWRSGD